MDLHTEFVVAVPASAAWHLLGEQFAAIGDWVTVIQASTLDRQVGVGAVRTCHLSRSKQVTEQLTEFDREAMTFSYVGTSNLPFGFVAAGNRWSVEAIDGGRCRIRSHAILEVVWWLRPLAPLLRFGMRRMMKPVMEELRFGLEEGRPHPRKLAALAAD